MAYKPILFNTEMVKAIINNRKTQTRRIIKNQEGIHPRWNNIGFCGWDDGHGHQMQAPCAVGDILWIRETFDNVEMGYPWYYKADGDLRPESWKGERWNPSIHMPKEAARIFLRVKDVRAERLQEITEQDAVREGISQLFDHMAKDDYEEWITRSGIKLKQSEHLWKNYLWHGNFGTHGMSNRTSNVWAWQFSGYESPRDSFSSLWNSMMQLKEWDVYGWGANPWVWVIEFERCEKPEAWC